MLLRDTHICPARSCPTSPSFFESSSTCQGFPHLGKGCSIHSGSHKTHRFCNAEFWHPSLSLAWLFSWSFLWQAFAWLLAESLVSSSELSHLLQCNLHHSRYPHLVSYGFGRYRPKPKRRCWSQLRPRPRRCPRRKDASRPECGNWVPCKNLSSSQWHQDRVMAFVQMECYSKSSDDLFLKQLDCLICPCKIHPIKGVWASPSSMAWFSQRCG